MKTAIILHGMPTEKDYQDQDTDAQSNAHWIPWLQQQLIARGILAQTPELPKPYKPAYEDWKEVFERFPIGEETILVGHSCGAGFLARWLSENPVKVGAVALVAPWMDPHGELPGFFDFAIDPNVLDRAERMTIFISNDDDEEMHLAVDQLAKAWPGANVMRMEGKGHFTLKDMGTREFPELRDALLG
jgi:hypothetical protein